VVCVSVVFLLFFEPFLPDFFVFVVDLVVSEEVVVWEGELPCVAAKLAVANGIENAPTINSVINFFILVPS
jgi:hypothetical protein